MVIKRVLFFRCGLLAGYISHVISHFESDIGIIYIYVRVCVSIGGERGCKGVLFTESMMNGLQCRIIILIGPAHGHGCPQVVEYRGRRGTVPGGVGRADGAVGVGCWRLWWHGAQLGIPERIVVLYGSIQHWTTDARASGYCLGHGRRGCFRPGGGFHSLLVFFLDNSEDDAAGG